MKKISITRTINGEIHTFYLTNEEIKEITEESEKKDIFEDFCTIIEQDYAIDVKWNQEIAEDIDIIYKTFNHVYDSDLSHWENIDKTIERLKDYDNTAFNYSKLRYKK